MKKRALLENLVHIDPDTFVTVAKHIGGGAAAHILSNAALKLFRGVKGNRALKAMGELGVQHGVEGKEIHPFVMDRIKQVVGPETVAEYTGARNLASKAVAKAPINVSTLLPHAKPFAKPGTMMTNQALKQHFDLKGMDMSSYPVLGNVQRAAESFVENGGQRTQNTGFTGKLIDGAIKALDKTKVNEGLNTGLANRKVRDLANAAVVAGTFPVPGVGDHIAINTLRDTATRMPAGRDWVKRRVIGGLHSEEPVKFFGKFGPAVVEGQGTLGKARRAMGDYLYSPTAWGEARDFGAKARKDGFNDESIKKITPILHDFM